MRGRPPGRAQGPGGLAIRVLSGAADLGDLVDFLSLVLDNVYSGIIVCDAECRIVFMNRVYGELLGTDPKLAVGDYLDKYFPHTRMPQVLSTGRSELGQRCSLKTDMPMLGQPHPPAHQGPGGGGDPADHLPRLYRHDRPHLPPAGPGERGQIL